jgi:hypothetical protein
MGARQTIWRDAKWLSKASTEVLVDAKYLRFKIFRSFLLPFSSRTRQKRMALFEKRFGLQNGTSVLDLGGQPMIWDSVSARLDITILNLPGIAQSAHPSKHAIRYVEGDACAVVGYQDKSFDIVFSNSVIEHVGDGSKQKAFAKEVRRLGRSYWVQTPSRWFPVEAHCGMPFWWLYPQSLRDYFLGRWKTKLPNWTSMVEGTTVIDRRDLEQLFPEARLFTELSLGFPKSYVAHHVGRG